MIANAAHEPGASVRRHAAPPFCWSCWAKQSQRRTGERSDRGRSPTGQPRNRAPPEHHFRTGRSRARRILSDGGGPRVRRARAASITPRRCCTGAFGPEAAKKIYDRLVKVLGNDVANFDILHKADPQQLAKFIHSEHPQTIALILSHLSPSQAAALLISLPAGHALRCRACAWPIWIRFRPRSSPRSRASSARSCSRSANSAANRMAACAPSRKCSIAWIPASAKRSSTTSKSSNAGLVETIRHLMFVFEDLLLHRRQRHQGTHRRASIANF